MSSEEALDDFYSALLDDDPESLYDRAPCGYLSTTPEGTIVKVNQTFLTLTGFERSDLVGRRTFSQLLSAGGRIYHDTHYSPMLQMQGNAREIALDLVRADGARLAVLVNAVLERDSRGAPTIIRAAVFDATHRREYEMELLRAKQRAEESEERARALARTLQQTLIPPHPPAVPGLDVAAGYRPAGAGDEVGGDFHDVFETSRGDWFVAVGDVCGKGVGAAVVTALARHTIRAAAVGASSPAVVLRVLNDVLLGDESSRFCTVVLAKISCRDATCEATIAVGGHPLPLHKTPGGLPTAVGRPGTLVGAFPEPDITDCAVTLLPGEELLLYTDGVTEARGAKGWFGEERLRESMASHSGGANSLVGGILADVVSFQGGGPRDDIAIVALRVP
ncbi:MAG: SpoIIE family protein phosphatase [Acidimicrobiia bacterium]